MKLKFKLQEYQADAVAAVCDIFAGQPNITSTYFVDKGFTGYNNKKILLSDEAILLNIQRIQRQNRIEPSLKLEGRYNLTVEMETGVGKTYTYIKTMFELNKRYGWKKFIVVVPSVAIREGVFKTFEITKDHFVEEYGKKIRYFIYNSQNLTKVDKFANDNGINAMIINSQAFNSRGKEARRIYMRLDSFRSRRPIDVIAAMKPILIIDEPQSVEGAVTKERLKEFKSLMTLRYSATHKNDSLYNLAYRLDALEAYNKKLVKKISVKGISVSGTTAAKGYLYLERINLSNDRLPTAVLEFEIKGAKGIKKAVRVIREGDNLYERSGGLEEYKECTVSRINGSTNTVEFTNGMVISAGDVVGSISEEHIRRIQIRETIKSHLEREHQLFKENIKVLSLFFIDEVAKYRQYDALGNAFHGEYARIFEEEYQTIINEWKLMIREEAYLHYLNGIRPEDTHAGYFSIDKKSQRMMDSRIGDRKQKISDDADAYDLIMRDKERLLDAKEPVRFIFSHSALREGWDNPNVFQICTLKQSGSDIRKRQEVGRGLRLCVNNNGERMDANLLGQDVHKVNILTVVANESYDSFAKRLQAEIAEAIADNTAYNSKDLIPENARSNNVEVRLNEAKLQMKEFKTLWNKINAKSAYVVDFETEELIRKSIRALNRDLRVSLVFFKVEHGEMNNIKSREALQKMEAFKKRTSGTERIDYAGNTSAKYDLIGKIVEGTGLTRSAAAAILKGIEKVTFEQFHLNPEEFIIKASNLINEQKATAIIEHITYNKLEEAYSADIFTGPAHIIYDSKNEKDFAQELDKCEEIAVYAKLPRGFYINTPVGKYNPDWAIAFHQEKVKHIYFVAETKGDLSSMQLRKVEELKIHCAREHFKRISSENVKYEVIDSYDALLNQVIR